MTNKEYIELKKTEYCQMIGVEHIDDSIDEDKRQEWFARLNQIRSGQLIGLSSASIDKFIILEGYERREFVKSCVFEGIPEDVLEKICACSSVDEMLKLKKEYYKSDYIINNIDYKMNTIRGTIDDCEQKFVVFEKYLDNFTIQIESKDKEIKELKETISELQQKLLKSADDMAHMKVQMVEATAVPTRNIVVTKIVENPSIKSEESDVANTKKKTLKSFLPGHSSVPKKEKEQQFLKEKVEKSISDIESYIIESNLTSEQLLEISKAITMDVTDEQIVMMIENDMSPVQIRNCVNVIIAKRNVEKKKHLSGANLDSHHDVSITEPGSSISDMISDMEEIDEDYIEEMEDIYE